MKTEPAIDDYIKKLPDDQRQALEHLRSLIQGLIPDGEECLHYQIPTFRRGRVIVGFAAAKEHCAFYPMSAKTVAAFQDELNEFSTSKATIRFQPSSPIPDDLVSRMVASRLAENQELDVH